jgi:hypothetical protein
VIGGDEAKNIMLFDLETDPSEQHDVSKKYPEIVERIKDIYNQVLTEVPEFEQPKRFKQLKRLKGGELKYDN